MKKAAVIYSGMWASDCHPFHSLARVAKPALKPEDMTESSSILVVWGGADISPALYGHPQSRTTYPGRDRDPIEWALMKRAVEMGIPIIGVCRGAQMLCALAGGFLIQDVRGHSGHHTVETHRGDSLTVNSIHHQMMAGLEKVPHELLAWSTTNRSNQYIWKDDQIYNPPEGFVEPEFVYFPEVRGFAIQWHPEMMSENSPATRFIMDEYEDRVNVTA